MWRPNNSIEAVKRKFLVHLHPNHKQPSGEFIWQCSIYNFAFFLNENLKLISRIRRVTHSLHIKNCSICVIFEGNISVSLQQTFIFSSSRNSCLLYDRIQCSTYLIIIHMFSSWICMHYMPRNANKQLFINQTTY